MRLNYNPHSCVHITAKDITAQRTQMKAILEIRGRTRRKGRLEMNV